MADSPAESTTQGSSSQAMVDDEPKGKIDMVGVLYIIGGVPTLVAFLVILFAITRACEGVPA